MQLQGGTPLHCAAHAGKPGAVMAMLQFGADPNALDHQVKCHAIVNNIIKLKN